MSIKKKVIQEKSRRTGKHVTAVKSCSTPTLPWGMSNPLHKLWDRKKEGNRLSATSV